MEHGASCSCAITQVLPKENAEEMMTNGTSDSKISIYGHGRITIYLPRSNVCALVRAIRKGEGADVNDRDLLQRLVGKLVKHLECQAGSQADTASYDGGVLVGTSCGRSNGAPIDPHETIFFTLSRTDVSALIRAIRQDGEADANYRVLLKRIVGILELHLA